MNKIYSTIYKLSYHGSLYTLFLLISLVPFHFALSKTSGVTFYREFFALLFIMFLTISLIELGSLKLRIRSEIFFLLLFPLLLSIAALYDPMVNLYQDAWGLATIASTFEGEADPRIYVLRNALLYLPMVIYLAIRGLSPEEINKIAYISVLIAPLSIVFYLYSVYEEGNLSIFLLGDMAEHGGANISYNSYVPYITFPFISAIYLIATKNGLILKSFCLGSLAVMSIFIFLSSSRQSILFILFAFFLFLIFDKSSIYRRVIFYCSILGSVATLFFIVLSDVEISEGLINKYQSGAETSRFQILINGFNLLRPHEFLTGAGLTSVVNSGPHNDYLRWTQRVGFIFMIISFMPFFIAAIKSSSNMFSASTKQIHIFISLALFFTLYHSIFGYPREDAFQALFCFLGLALYLGYQKYKIFEIKEEKHQ